MPLLLSLFTGASMMPCALLAMRVQHEHAQSDYTRKLAFDALSTTWQAMPQGAIMPRHFGPTGAPVKIFAFGDSLTAGFNNGGHDPYYPYGDYLQKALGDEYQVIVDGISGSAAGLHWLQHPQAGDGVHPQISAAGVGPGILTMLDRHPDAKLAIIMLGTNDIGGGEAAHSVVQYVAQVHEICHTRGIRTLMLKVPKPINMEHPLFEKREVVNAGLEHWCANHHPMCAASIDTSNYLRIGDPAEQRSHAKANLHYAPQAYVDLGIALAKLVPHYVEGAESDNSENPFQTARKNIKRVQRWVKNRLQ